MWLLLPHSMSINRGKKQGHQIHSAYDIALFQQSLHSFIHPPTNKSLDLNKWRWRRRLRVKERGLERQSHLLRGCAPFYLVWWLTLLLMGRFLSLLWCFTIFSSSQCAFGGEAPDWLWLARGGWGRSQYGENRIGPCEVRMGPGAGLKMAWLRGGPCRRWWCGWWAEAAARRASGLEEAAAAIAAATARGLGRRPAPNALVRSYMKINIMTQRYHIVIWIYS